jgi:hypothetical protein
MTQCENVSCGVSNRWWKLQDRGRILQLVAGRLANALKAEEGYTLDCSRECPELRDPSSSPDLADLAVSVDQVLGGSLDYASDAGTGQGGLSSPCRPSRFTREGPRTRRGIYRYRKERNEDLINCWLLYLPEYGLSKQPLHTRYVFPATLIL